MLGSLNSKQHVMFVMEGNNLIFYKIHLSMTIEWKSILVKDMLI
jgi:hypothetical protein